MRQREYRCGTCCAPLLTLESFCEEHEVSGIEVMTPDLTGRTPDEWRNVVRATAAPERRQIIIVRDSFARSLQAQFATKVTALRLGEVYRGVPAGTQIIGCPEALHSFIMDVASNAVQGVLEHFVKEIR